MQRHLPQLNIISNCIRSNLPTTECEAADNWAIRDKEKRFSSKWSEHCGGFQPNKNVIVKSKTRRGNSAAAILSDLLLHSLIFPGCLNWMRRQIHSLTAQGFLGNISWFMSFARLLNCYYHLPGCCCVFILRGVGGCGGIGGETDRAGESCISRGLCDRIREGCKIWWTPSNWHHACVCACRLPECVLS